MSIKFVNKNLPIPDGWRKSSTNPNGNSGKICITNGKKNRFIKSIDEMPQNGKWAVGSCNAGNTDFFWITDGTVDKQVPPGSEVPNGWRIGRRKSPTKGYFVITNGKKDSCIPIGSPIPDGWWKGRVSKGTSDTMWIHNGKERRCIKTTDPIPDGFVKGYKLKLIFEFEGKLYGLSDICKIVGFTSTPFCRRYFDMKMSIEDIRSESMKKKKTGVKQQG